MSRDGGLTPRIPFSRRARLGVGLALVCAAVLGCESRAEPTSKRFIPPVETARSALATALGAWKDGRPSGRIDARPAAIQFVDSARKPDQRLASFEILGEVPDDHYRCFKVRLVLEQPDERPLARYFIFGINPLWVYRAEDLEMITHWDHHIEPADEVESVPTEKSAREPAVAPAAGEIEKRADRGEPRGLPDPSTNGPN
jgi:hypothetical protein